MAAGAGGGASQQLYSLNNPVFASLMFYSAVVLIKLMLMSLLTVVKRFSNGAFANQEDIPSKKAKVDRANESVERVRRNHLNDLENIPAFIFLSLFYISIQPTQLAALWHFRIFAASRVLHTLVYQLAIPQPARALTFMVGLGVCVSMAYQIILATVNL